MSLTSSRGPPRALMLPEIVTIIFERMAFVDDGFPRFTSSTPCDDWFPATHTCQTWRRVAIATARIWGCIWTAMPPNLTRLFLQRSKSTPLYLWTCGFRPNLQTVSMVLDSHAARLVEVEITDFEPAWFDSLFAMPTPHLKAVTLSSRIEPDKLDEWNDDERCRFSETALHEGVPNLQSLSVSGFTVHLDSPLLCNLTSLDLSVEHGTYTADLYRLSPTEFLRALQGMPRLCSLHVSYSLEPCWPLDHPVVVTLPVLSDLQAREEYLIDLKVLQYMTLPSIERIALACDEVVDYEDIGIIAPHIHALLPPHDPSLTQTTLMVIASRHEGQPASRTILKLDAQPTDHPPVALAFGFGGLNCFLADEPLLAFQPLPPIKILDFDGYAEVQNNEDPCFLSPFFCAMTDVTELRVRDLRDIAFVLEETPGTPCEGDVPLYALPSLKRISLFQERNPKHIKWLVIRVKNILLERKALGAAVDMLEVVLEREYGTIPESKITPQDLQPLTEVIEVIFPA